MEEHNAYPNSTRYFFARVPEKQKSELEAEINAVLEELPLLKEVVEHLESRIAATDSVKQALELSDKYEISREDALIILDIVRQQLDAERVHITSKVEKVRQK